MSSWRQQLCVRFSAPCGKLCLTSFEFAANGPYVCIRGTLTRVTWKCLEAASTIQSYKSPIFSILLSSYSESSLILSFGSLCDRGSEKRKRGDIGRKDVMLNITVAKSTVEAWCAYIIVNITYVCDHASTVWEHIYISRQKHDCGKADCR